MGRGAGCAFAVVSDRRRTRSTPLIGRCLGEEDAIAPPFGDVPLGSGSGEQRSIPTYAPGHWEQDPRISLMAKPEKPNNGFSIGAPQMRTQGFRGAGRGIVNSG